MTERIKNLEKTLTSSLNCVQNSGRITKLTMITNETNNKLIKHRAPSTHLSKQSDM